MRRLLQRPAANAVFLCLFTAFYFVVFLTISQENQPDGVREDFWGRWCSFLAGGGQRGIAFALLAVTVVTVVLLLLRRQPYDEYHLSQLLTCFTVALALTLVAIAVFFLLIVLQPTAVVEKCFLFAALHWGTVVCADFVYVLMFQRR